VKKIISTLKKLKPIKNDDIEDCILNTLSFHEWKRSMDVYDELNEKLGRKVSLSRYYIIIKELERSNQILREKRDTQRRERGYRPESYFKLATPWRKQRVKEEEKVPVGQIIAIPI